MMKKNNIHRELNDLVSLIRRLRAPDGCPWDRKQKLDDIGKYIIEEAYEVVESLEVKDGQALQEELGDLLFQILFLAEIGEEIGAFSLIKIMEGIKEKMIRRHPHIFGDIKVNTIEEVKENWQQIKKKERRIKRETENIFEDIPRSLPALKRAQKISVVAADYGLDWQKATDVIKKVEEELIEFSAALRNNDQINMEEELGDLFFTLVNLSRFVKIDSETALSRATNKFLRRFEYITKQLKICGKPLEEASSDEMNILWEEAKIKA
jgi:tetrapyrrole methylase family protein / MazG family protein